MKQFLLFILLIAAHEAKAQFPQVQIFSPAVDSQVVNGKVWDTDGNMTIAPYVGVLNSNGMTPDGYWVIQPSNDTSARWVLLTRPDTKNISASSYTVLSSDFNKTINLSNTSSRAITMPDITTVNTTRIVSFKDVAGTAGANPITVTYSGGIDGGTTLVIDCNYCEKALYKKTTTSTIYSAK